MNPRQPIRMRLAAAAAICALALSGCVAEQFANSGSRRHLVPLSPQTVALIEQKGMTKQSPILLRIFKEESELEIWKQTAAGRYELLKKYPICKWSGQLGPKVKEGDRQAPEGFYAIRPELMQPHSSYHLAFNLGYPNDFDRALNRTGSHLMVHGDCSSRGCYAMTDEQIAEIFALAREAFDGGQLAFQVQAYPFRMTNANLARHRNNPNAAFWRMLKEGNDHFEVTRQEPKIDVCARRYVFNAVPEDPMKPFDPSKPCPAYHIQPEIAQALQSRRAADNNDITALVTRTVMPAAPVNTGQDGGSNPAFAAQNNPPVVTSPSDAAVPQAAPQSHPQAVSGNRWSITRMLGFEKETPTARAMPQDRPAATTQRTQKQKTKRTARQTPEPEPEEDDEPQARPELPGATPIRPANGGFSFMQ